MSVVPAPGRAVPLIGREAELAIAGRFLDRVADGPLALLVTGEAGIGKTSLLRWTVAEGRRRGHRVLATRPAETDAQLAFAGLTDLLDGVGGDELGELPGPQRRALDAALRRADDTGDVEPLAVSHAVLNVLRGLTAGGPLLLVVDDLPWLDGPTARTLEFVLRRLDQEPIGMVATIRTGLGAQLPAGLGGLPDERLERLVPSTLDVDAVGRLIRDRLGADLRRTVVVRIHGVSGGNPFYALELARAMVRRGTAGRDELAVPESLGELVRDRLAALGPAAADAALVVAAALQPTRSTVEAAMDGREDGPDGLAEAIAAGVIEELPGGRLAFSHPLLKFATYSAASVERRRTTHGRLASVVTDPDERIRHQAIECPEPDEGVAAGLEAAAGRAGALGAPETAAQLLWNARVLTPADRLDDIRRRSVAAAESCVRAGDPRRAREILEPLVASAPPGPARAAAASLLADIRSGDDWRARVELHRSVLAEAGERTPVRAELETALAVAGWVRLEDLPGALDHGRAARAIAADLDDPSVLVRAIGTLAFIESFAGVSDGLELVAEGIALESEAPGMRVLFRPSFAAGLMLESADRLDDAVAAMERLVRLTQDQGDSDSLPLALINLAVPLIRLGRWDEAARHLESADAAAGLLGHPTTIGIVRGYRAWLHGCRGNLESARADGSEALGIAARTGARLVEGETLEVLAAAEFAAGDAEAAWGRLAAVLEMIPATGLPTLPRMGRALLPSEPLIALGRVDEAETFLDPFEAAVRRLDRPSGIAAALRSRALVAAARGDLDRALALVGEAWAQHDRVPEPLERARTRLVEGEIQRRLRRRAAAREAIGDALATFEALGARTWAERARAELARTGLRSPGGGPSALTPAERQIADLVAVGHTNREVAAALFMSPHTVEAHLSNIYRTLGIRSRVELARALADPGSAGDEN